MIGRRTRHRTGVTQTPCDGGRIMERCRAGTLRPPSPSASIGWRRPIAGRCRSTSFARCSGTQRPQGVRRPAGLRASSNAIWPRCISRTSPLPVPARADTKAPGSTSSGSIVRCSTKRPMPSIPTAVRANWLTRLYGELFGLVERERRTAVAVRVLSWPQQSRHVAARGAGPASCRPRSQRPAPGAAACRRRRRSLWHTPANGIEPRTTGYIQLMRRAVTAAVARLAPKDRLRLAYYYAQELTLAQIGRALGEHEATVSRNLARARREIRTDVERQLREQEHMNTSSD